MGVLVDKRGVVTARSGIEWRIQNVQTSIQNFANNLTRIYDIADKFKEHIPPITSLDSAPFPYKIIIPEKKSDHNRDYHTGEEGWGTYIKKILD